MRSSLAARVRSSLVLSEKGDRLLQPLRATSRENRLRLIRRRMAFILAFILGSRC
ncbi:hypothetical protein D3C78_1740880 [compost metagenome]